MSKTKDFLFEICNKPFVSGFENVNSEILNSYFSEYTDSSEKDALHSYIFKKNGEGKRSIMIAAHIDEIGLIVTQILDNGFLKFSTVGGINPASLIGQEVVIYGKEEIRGAIGIKPPHITPPEEMKKATKIADLFIDTGLSKEDTEKIVSIGNVITVYREAISLENNMVTCKALDNKAGVATMYKAAQELSKLKHTSDVYFTATSQEEVGLKGAKTSSYKIDPDLAIVLDVGFGNTPEMPPDILKLGKGPGICIGANFNPKLTKKLREIAKEYNFNVQIEVAPGRSGTDSAAIQINRKGVPCVLLSIPLRYMHTSVEVISMNDVETTGALIARFISEIDNFGLEEITCF